MKPWVAVAVTDRRPLTVAVRAVAVAVGTSAAGAAEVGEGWSVGTGTLGDMGAEVEAIMADTCGGRGGEVGEGIRVGTRTPSLAFRSKRPGANSLLFNVFTL